MDGWWMVQTTVRPVSTVLRIVRITIAAARASSPGVMISAFSESSTFIFSITVSHAVPAKRGKVRPADKLHVKAAKFLPLVGLARSKKPNEPWARYLYHPPPAGANSGTS